MRQKLAVVWALALALAVVAAYNGYMSYREKQVIDVVNVKVTDFYGKGISGVLVYMVPLNGPSSSIESMTNNGGVTIFYNIQSGKYDIRLPNSKNCGDSFIVKLRGARADILIYDGDGKCRRLYNITPRE